MTHVCKTGQVIIVQQLVDETGLWWYWRGVNGGTYFGPYETKAAAIEFAEFCANFIRPRTRA